MDWLSPKRCASLASLTDQLTDWLVTADDDGLVVELSLTGTQAAILVVDRVIWCSEYHQEYPDCDEHPLTLEWLKAAWRSELERLTRFTPQTPPVPDGRWTRDKPPNGEWVEVRDGEQVLKARAMFIKDFPHWEIAETLAKMPASKFREWRLIDESPSFESQVQTALGPVMGWYDTDGESGPQTG